MATADNSEATQQAGKGDYQAQFFEAPGMWERISLENPDQRKRIEDTIACLPPDAHTLLDVGCGNGLFVNTLTGGAPDRFGRVVGLDLSEEALKDVHVEKVRGSITDLPFERGSFDLVTCLEVLEHIPQPEFEAALAELGRVSSKYVLLTVPNNQDLRLCLVVCRKCHCGFNPDFHVRSFDRSSLRGLLAPFRLVTAKEIGPARKRHSYGRLLTALYQHMCRPAPPDRATCPQCGQAYAGAAEERAKSPGGGGLAAAFLGAAKSLVNVFAPVRGRTSWLLALYEKTEG